MTAHVAVPGWVCPQLHGLEAQAALQARQYGREMRNVPIFLALLVAAALAVLGISNVTFVVLLLAVFFAVVGRVVWAMRFS